MASLYTVQLIGEYDIEEQKVMWHNTPAGSIAEKGLQILGLNYQSEPIFVVRQENNRECLTINNNKAHTIVYFCVQGVPGTRIHIEDTRGVLQSYLIGCTGIMEFEIYNDNPVKIIKIFNDEIFLNSKTINLQGNNEKCIVDVVYKINRSNI